MDIQLNRRISTFYDDSTQLWLDVWGEHMHHGYYPPGQKDRKDHLQAQVDMIEQLLDWAGIDSATRILDAGCGVGGSARLLSQRFGAEALGVNLSPVQVGEARRRTAEAGLQEKVQFRQADILSLDPEELGQFDLIWSLENAEHIGDKGGMLQLFHRLLRPGGKLLCVTWCTRPVPPTLTEQESNTLRRISDWYHLPPMISIPAYDALARQAGFEAVETEDWMELVAPFWPAVVRSTFSWRSVRGLLRSGMGTIRGAVAMRYMIKAYREGTLKYGLIQGRKPSS